MICIVICILDAEQSCMAFFQSISATVLITDSHVKWQNALFVFVCTTYIMSGRVVSSFILKIACI